MHVLVFYLLATSFFLRGLPVRVLRCTSVGCTCTCAPVYICRLHKYKARAIDYSCTFWSQMQITHQLVRYLPGEHDTCQLYTTNCCCTNANLVFPTGFTCACAPVHICRVYLYVCSCVHLSSSQVQSSCYTLQLYFLMSNANYTSTRMVFARRAWYMPAIYYELLLYECHRVRRSSLLSTLLVYSSSCTDAHADVCCSSCFVLKIPLNPCEIVLKRQATQFVRTARRR